MQICRAQSCQINFLFGQCLHQPKRPIGASEQLAEQRFAQVAGNLGVAGDQFGPDRGVAGRTERFDDALLQAGRGGRTEQAAHGGKNSRIEMTDPQEVRSDLGALIVGQRGVPEFGVKLGNDRLQIDGQRTRPVPPRDDRECRPGQCGPRRNDQ